MTYQQIGELYERYAKYLIRVIRSRLFDGCPEDYAFDCLDEVFTIAMEKSDDEKFNRDPAGWLVVTARYVVDNFNRKNVNRLKFQESNFSFDLNKMPASGNLVEDLALKIFIEDNIWVKIMNDLSRDDRVLLIMRYYQKKELDAIAAELHIPKGTLKVRINRMKHRVKKLIRYYLE